MSTSALEVWFDDDVGDDAPAPCTRLYGLEPQGLGTPWCESLTSYLVRLAHAHGIGPRDAVRGVLALDSSDIAAWDYAAFYRRYAATINGTGSYARTLSAALERCTARSLACLTWLPLATLLPTRGTAVVHPCRRWCPACLAASKSDVPPQPLAWTLAAASHCAWHGAALVDRCPWCRRPQPAIPRRPSFVRCDHCGRSLIGQSGNVEGPTADAHALWRARAAADLARVLPTLGTADLHARWLRFIAAASERASDGNRAELCRRIGLPRNAFNNWFAKSQRPSIDIVLHVLEALSRWPSQVLAPVMPEVAARDIAVGRPDRQTRPRRFVDRAYLAAQLQRHLVEEMTPIALARSLNVSRASLKRVLPDVHATCRQYAKRTAEMQRRRVRAKRAALIASAIETLLREGQFPGRRRVDAIARKAGFSLMNYELLALYRAMLVDRQPESAAAFRAALVIPLRSFCPCSLPPSLADGQG